VSIGIAILALTLARIGWRLAFAAPAYPDTMSSLEKSAASLTKFELPAIPGWLFLGEAEEVHELASHAWIPVAGLHAAAALWHHRFRRDGVLTRMLPGRNA
jgi:cytochrome b561